MKRIAYSADHSDVYRHLAAEEIILQELPSGSLALYLWVADDAMVIGKNQNPWLECNLPLMAENDCRLARRISGGGAVFHDLGNLNYSFFMEKSVYDRDMLSAIILDALSNLGIRGTVGERHLLEVEGKKFSGNAFCYRKNKVLHHGTLLVKADLHKLTAYAKPTCDGLDAKGIRSIPSEVGNLADYKSDLTVSELKDAIYSAFESPEPPHPFSHEVLDERSQSLKTDAWCYHRTPRFIARGTCPNTCASFEAEVVKGVVTALVCTPTDVAFEEWAVGRDFREFLTETPHLILE